MKTLREHDAIRRNRPIAGSGSSFKKLGAPRGRESGATFARRALAVLAATAASFVLAACATATGAALGAGIGSLSGDAGKGAVIGGSIGAVVDIVD